MAKAVHKEESLFAPKEQEVMDKKDDKREKRLTKTQSSFLKLFDCPVCFERIAPPVTVCINGHAVCRECKKHLLTCPTCKASFSAYKNTMIDQIIEENLFLCKNNDRGCTEEMKFREIEVHEKNFCRHRTLKCDIEEATGKCEKEVPIWEYYMHVYRNHPQETLHFRQETHRILNISDNIAITNILKDAADEKIMFEKIKLDRERKKFYIMYQFIGLNDDSMFTLRLYHKKQKYKELVYKNVCLPIGMGDEELERSEKCLVLDSNLVNSFASDSQLYYSIKIETIPKKWFETLKEKMGMRSIRLSFSNGVRSSSSQ